MDIRIMNKYGYLPCMVTTSMVIYKYGYYGVVVIYNIGHMLLLLVRRRTSTWISIENMDILVDILMDFQEQVFPEIFLRLFNHSHDFRDPKKYLYFSQEITQKIGIFL